MCISILVPKTATRAMDSFSILLAKIEMQLIGEVWRIEKKVQVTNKCPWYQFEISKKFNFCANLSKFIVSSIFGKKIKLFWCFELISMALVAVFGTKIEMSPHETKQLPKWRYLFGGKFFQNFSKAKNFFNRSNKWLKIMLWLVSAVELVEVKIWWIHAKALGMKMWKLVLGLSRAQILLEKINKMFS